MSILTPSAELLPSAIHVTICLCAYKQSFLLLLRNPQKPLGLLWCAPGGKLNSGESPDLGAIRELQEETGIQATTHDLHVLGSYLMSYEGEIYQFHLYLLKRDSKEERIALSYEEHIAFTWVDLAQMETLNLMPGLFELVEIGTNYSKGNSEVSS